MTHSTPSTPPDRSAPRKSTLHCPACGHESLADGDWEVADEEGDDADTEPDHERVAYTCPDCGAVVTVRSHRRAVVA